MQQMNADGIQLLADLLRRDQGKSLLLVAIDGHSAAGKSTVARQIRDGFDSVTIVQMDDFYRAMDPDERAGLSAEDGYFQYYDWERVAAQVLEPLSQGKDSRYQKYDWNLNRLDRWVDVKARGIVVIEGCYSARPELKGYYDIILLVQTSAERRRQRQLDRADATLEWLERWDAAEHWYMERFQPIRYADALITGETP